MCNFMVPDHMNYWKEAGINLGIHKAKLDAIEFEKLNKADKCCYEMLAKWLECDVNATMEKLKKVVRSLSDSKTMVLSSDLLVNFKKYLQQRYAHMSINNIANITYICHQRKVVTNESVRAVAKAAYYGNIVIDCDQCNNQQLFSQSNQVTDYYAKCTKSTNILNLLIELDKPDSAPVRDKPFLLLIEGAQGMGKTAICKEIAYQWTKHRGLDGQFTFLICLNEINPAYIRSFRAFLEYLCSENQPGTIKALLGNLHSNLHSNRGDKVMVIIDGYENLFAQQKYSVDSFIHKIINREISVLQQCDLVISSCHTASVKLYNCNNCTRIELLGFTEEAKQQYIDNALDHTQENTDELMAYLKEHSSLNSLCYYPLCLKEMVYLFQQSKFSNSKLLTSEAEVIDRITNRMVLSLSDSKKMDCLPLTTAFKDMSKELQFTLKTIGKLAFYSLQTKDYTFKLSDIDRGINSVDVEKCCSNGLGFLKVINFFDNTDINQMLFTFLHFVLQEFLAAFYLSTLSQNNCIEIYKQTFWKSEYINVWAYYCDITRDNNIIKKMVLGSWQWLGFQKLPDNILQDKMSCLYLVHCFTESPDNEIYQEVKSKVICDDTTLDLSSYNFSEEDFHKVVLYLSHSKVQQWINLDLSYCYIDDNKLACFFQKLQPFMKSLPGIRVLNLSNNQLSRISIHHVFKIAAIFNTVKIILSCNEIQDQELCKSVISFVEKSNDSFRTKVIHNCESFFLLRSQDLLQDLKLDSNLTCLYVIRCSLENDKIDSLVQVLKSSDTLSLVFLYENNLNHCSLVKIVNEFKVIKQFKNVLIFEKKLSDISIDETNFRVFLLSTSIKLLAYKAVDYQILMALEYNLSIVHLQLNDCHITDEVMSKIAVILNNSSQQWSLLDLSGSNVGDESLAIFSNELDGNSAVSSLNLASNKLTSLSLISKLIWCLNPKVFDISRNSFTNEVANSTSLPISMMVAEKLFTQEKQLSLTLTCDNDIVLYCHKLNHAITAESVTAVRNNFTQVFVSDCTITVEMLLGLLHSYDSLIFLHLVHVKWSGESLYNLPEFFKIDIFLSICKNSIPKQIVNNVVKMFDADVNISRIISTDDIFIAHKCSYELLKGYLTWQLLPLPSTKSLFYIRNCSLDTKHQNCNVVTDYLCTQSIVTEIVLCNNGLTQNNIQRMIKKFLQLKMPIFEYIFICELQQRLVYGTMTARWLLKKFNCSFIIIERKAFIGRKTTSVHIDRCLSLFSPVTTFSILRFINCSFGNEHYNTLAGIISHHENLNEFSLYECNTNYVSTKILVDPLQMKSTLTSLLLSCNKVTPVEADSLATSLSTVISNNYALEKVSFKIDGLHSSACAKIFQALSNIKHLKSFRFCDAQITTKEAVFQLKKVIANNPSLKIVNLRNNKLQSLGVKALSEGFGSICHLKLLALNGNQIDEEAADDIASVINKNLEIEKLLLYNNALKSEGVSKICQALKYHSCLQVFRIGHNYFHEEAADDIAEVINHNPKLKIVDIGGNRLLTRGIMKIAKNLEKATNLHKLSLNESYITYTKKATTSIGRVVKSNTSLKALHLDNNNLSVSDISMIAESINELTGLKELTVNNTGCTADHITTMISNNLLLETLDIGDNQLKSEGIRNVSKALIKLNRLKVLGLYGNEITDDAAGDIADVIYNLPLLEKLLLNNNTFGVVGIQTICKSLQQNRTLKLLQLINVGITEEVADDIAAVIDGNPLLQCIYLESNRLQNSGANVILGSLSNKKHIKALSLASNNISEIPVNKLLQFITNNELDELLLNNNSIGTTGVFDICKCIKDNINTLRVFSFADTNVSDEATDAIISVIESNNALEKISVDGNMLMLDDNKLLTAIAKLSNPKCLQINFKVFTVNTVYRLVDFVFTNSKIEELTFNNLVEEIHLLSSLNPVETIVVIKTNANELSSCKPIVHSVIMENKIEIVCKKDDVLMESEVIKIINAKICQRLMLVFTRMNCYTDQEINVLANNIADSKIINSLVISKLNANEYNSDVSGIVIIEGSEMIVMLTDDSLTGTGITKLLHKVENITSLILCTDRGSKFSDPSINEIVDLISNTNKLCKFIIRNNSIHVKAMKSVINYLTENINTKTIKVLNKLNIRNFDFIQKSDHSLFVEEIDKHHWHKILFALKHSVDLKILDLSGNAISKEIAQYLSVLLNETTKLELLYLNDCFLGMNLNYIDLHKVSTLKYLDLSNNFLTEVEPIRAILKNNTSLKELSIEKNYFQQTAGDKLSTVVTNLKNLNDFRTDQNIISRKMIIKLTTAFSTATQRQLVIYNHDYQIIEGISVTGLLHNTTTLSLCKCSAKIQDVSFLAAVLQTGVMFSLWDQDNALNRAGIIRWFSDSRKITTIKLFNGSKRMLTEQEEDTITTIIRENTQLENVLLGNQSFNSVVDDFCTFEIERNRKPAEHHKAVSNSKTDTSSKANFLSNEFLFKVISALKCHANLKILNLSSCPDNVITLKLVEKLAIVLANSAKLEMLFLGDCSLGNEGVNVIANSLKNINTLKLLDLSGNNITEELSILTILKHNTTLKSLYIEKNCFSAADSLSVHIVNLKCLKVLSIDQNIMSRSMALTLANSCSRTSEMELIIYNNHHQATEVVTYKCSHKNVINALTFLKSCNEKKGSQLLTTLILKDESNLIWNQCNILSPTGVITFLSAFRSITTINVINVSGTEFTELEVDAMAIVISENMQLENLWLSIPPKTDASASDSNGLKDESENEQFILPCNNDQLKRCSHKLQIFPHNLLLKIFHALKSCINLKTLDISGNVITEELADQLAIVLSNSTKLEALLLMDCFLGNESVNVIANSLKNITTLKHINLSNNNITEESSILTILKNNINLEELYIEKNCLHSSAGDSLTVHLVNLKCLKVLSIDQNIISRNMALKLAFAFSPVTERTLYIYNHDYQTMEGLKIIGSFNIINTLTLCKVPIVKEHQVIMTLIENGSVMFWWSHCNVQNITGVLKFLCSLKQITTIKLGNISGKEFTKLEIDAIATIISESVQLKYLWLGSQSYRVITKDSVGFKEEFNFSSDGLSKDEMQKQNWQLILSEKRTKPATYKLHLFLCSEVLINMFSHSVNLKTLDLSGNVITEELAKQLAIALANSTKLEALLLESCSLGNKGVNLIADSLKDLKHLDLSSNDITEYQALNSILKSNVTLQKLYLEKNCLDCTAGDKMIISIVNLKCLKVLSIDQNIISRNMTLKLATAFSTDIKRKLFIYNHDYQSTEILDIRGSLHNITTLTLCRCSLDVPLVTAVLETRTVLLKWYQSHALNTTGVLQFFSASNNITTIKLHKFASDSEFTSLEVDVIAAVISDNLLLANLWLGSHSHKVVHDDINVLINKPDHSVDCSNDLDLLPQKLQLIPEPLLFKILSALKNNTNVKTLDLSGNVITDKLAELLAIVLVNSTKLETLLLMDCSLRSIGTYVIANSIKNIVTLKQLSLSWDNITKTTAECLETLIDCNTGLSKLYLDGSLQCVNKHSTATILCSIKKLNLELLQIDCEVIAKVVPCELVNSLINNGKFKCLILKNHSLQVTGMIKFENFSKDVKSLVAIRTTGQDSTSVTASIEDSKVIVLWSQDNVLASTGVSRIVGVAFKGLTSVSWVNLTFNDYTDTDVNDIVTLTASFTELEELVVAGYSTALQNYIFNSLNKLKNLKRIDLTLSKFHTNAMAKLPSFLLNYCEIQELKLNYCLFKSFQIAEIINALKTHTCLQSLSLFDANITDVLSIVHDIGQVLHRNQSMCKFYIGNNRLQARGITKILEVLKQFHNLTELSIGRNITDEISDSIVKTKLCDFLAEVITNNVKLEVLGIDYVCLHAEGAAKVVKALKSLCCLKVIDISGNNINKETTDDIADVITNNPNLVKLFLANNYIETTRIADALVNTKGLETLDFSNNNISSAASESLSKIISNNPQLKVLLLGWEKIVIENHSKSVLHNNISNSGISTTKLSSVFIDVQMLIIKLHAKGNMTRFISATCIIQSSIFYSKLFSEGFKMPFNYNQLQSEGIKKISKALTGITSLEILSIENNDVDDDAAGGIATALASNTGIKQLWIGQNNFTSSGISVILQSLIGNLQLSFMRSLPGVTREDNCKPTLHVLDLGHSNFSLKIADDISAVLSKNYKIQQLWLEGNNILSQSITTIAATLKKCTNISVLNLRENNITEEVAGVLSEALSEKSDLQQLYLGNNQLEDRGVIRISKALNTTHGLLTLDLVNNNISEAAADALASVITSCSQLEQLYLGDNKLHSTGTIRIATAIQQANCRSTLRVLDLSNNGIGSDETVADEISRAVANTEILTVLILDDNALSIDGLLKITRSLDQSESAEWMMIFSVMRNGVVIGEEAERKMRAVMADQRLADCVMYL